MNIGIGIGADIAILVISDIGKIYAGKPIFLLHLVLLSI